MKPYLLLDVDGVLLDWLSGFENFLLVQAPHLHKDFSGLQHVENLEQLLGMDDAQIHDWIDRFHHDASFKFLKPLPGTQKTINLLKNWCRLVCITASGTSPASVAMRRQNLNQVFGPCFERIICVERSSDKPAHLSAYPAGYWVEDQLKNALMGVHAGHESFLMDAMYNKQQDHALVHRVKNLAQVGEIILSQLRSTHL